MQNDSPEIGFPVLVGHLVIDIQIRDGQQVIISFWTW